MKKFFSVCTLLLSLNVLAAPIPEGAYVQEAVKPADWGKCPTCSVTITNVTPNLINIKSNNGWHGYAVYYPNKDTYYGHSQWENNKGAHYAAMLYATELKFDGRAVHYKGKAINSNTGGLLSDIEITYAPYK